jgi:putative transposase
VVERLFGTTTTELLNQLRGNTQASKTPRAITRAMDPKRLAVWALERFAGRLAEFVHEVYDRMDHPALFQSPREAFEQGMRLAGSRSHRLIIYSDEFVMQTRPTTRTGTVKIHPARGIRVNGLQYWHDSMQTSQVAGQTVPVRYESYGATRSLETGSDRGMSGSTQGSADNYWSDVGRNSQPSLVREEQHHPYGSDWSSIRKAG